MSTIIPQLSLAEALLLENHTLLASTEYLAYTLAELIFLDVVKVVKKLHKPHASDPALEYYFLYRGSNFHNYEFRLHQDFLLLELKQNEKVLLHLLAKRTLKHCEGNLDLYRSRLILPSVQAAQLIPKGRFFSLMNFSFHLKSAFGKVVMKEIHKSIRALTVELKKGPKANFRKTGELVNSLGPLMLLSDAMMSKGAHRIPPKMGILSKYQNHNFKDLYDWGNISQLPPFARLANLNFVMEKFRKGFKVFTEYDLEIDYDGFDF